MLKHKAIPFNTATPRQAILYTFWGIVAGVYCFQPMLGLTAKDRRSLLGYVADEDDIKEKIKQLKSKNQNNQS